MNVKYNKEILQDAVNKSESIYDVLRSLHLREAGGSHSHISRRIKFFNIDTSHFCGKTSANGRPGNKKPIEEILILRSSGRRTKAYQLRRALIESGVPHICGKCGMEPVWNGNKLTFEVDHINENWLDDRINNLRFLCPNCHTQITEFNTQVRVCGNSGVS